MRLLVLIICHLGCWSLSWAQGYGSRQFQIKLDESSGRRGGPESFRPDRPRIRPRVRSEHSAVGDSSRFQTPPQRFKAPQGGRRSDRGGRGARGGTVNIDYPDMAEIPQFFRSEGARQARGFNRGSEFDSGVNPKKLAPRRQKVGGSKALSSQQSLGRREQQQYYNPPIGAPQETVIDAFLGNQVFGFDGATSFDAEAFGPGTGSLGNSNRGGRGSLIGNRHIYTNEVDGGGSGARVTGRRSPYNPNQRLLAVGAADGVSDGYSDGGSSPYPIAPVASSHPGPEASSYHPPGTETVNRFTGVSSFGPSRSAAPSSLSSLISNRLRDSVDSSELRNLRFAFSESDARLANSVGGFMRTLTNAFFGFPGTSNSALGGLVPASLQGNPSLPQVAPGAPAIADAALIQPDALNLLAQIMENEVPTQPQSQTQPQTQPQTPPQTQPQTQPQVPPQALPVDSSPSSGLGDFASTIANTITGLAKAFQLNGATEDGLDDYEDAAAQQDEAGFLEDQGVTEDGSIDDEVYADEYDEETVDGNPKLSFNLFV